MGRPKITDEGRKVARAVGRRLRALRIAQGLSQEQFAAKAGVHRTQVGFMERGENVPSVLTLIQTAKALDSTASEVLRDVGF